MLTFSFLMTMALIMETVVGDNVIGDKKKIGSYNGTPIYEWIQAEDELKILAWRNSKHELEPHISLDKADWKFLVTI